jgi:uncharacterized phage infection (PIP) family protein YhgE
VATNFSVSANLDSSGFKRGTDEMAEGLDTAARAMADLESQDLGRVEDAVDDVADKLDDISDAARDAGDDLGDALEDGADKAEDAADDLAKKYRDAFNDVEKKAKQTDVKIDVDIDKDKSDKALNSFKEDVAASGNESGQELAGSMMDGFNGENVVEALTEVVAEATEGMSGPMQAAGIGLAIVIALAYAEMQKLADKTNEAKEAGGEWSSSFNTAAVSDRLGVLRDKFQEFATEIKDESSWYEFGEAAETALEQIQDGADEGGVAVKDFMKAFMEENPTARLELLEDALANTRDRIDDLDAQKRNAGPFESWDLANKTRELHESEEALSDLTDEQRIANETEKAMADAMGVTIEQFRKYNDLSDEAKDKVDELAEGDRGAAIEAEGHAEARAELNEEIEDGIDASRDLVKATWDLEDAEKELNKQLGDGAKKGRASEEALFDYAGAAIDAAEANEKATGKTRDYNKVIDDAADKFRKSAEDAGYNKEEIDKMIRKYGLVPKKVNTDIKTSGKSKAIQDMNDVLTKAGIKKDLTVGVRAATGSADTDVSNFRARQARIPVTLQLRAV